MSRSACAPRVRGSACRARSGSLSAKCGALPPASLPSPGAASPWAPTEGMPGGLLPSLWKAALPPGCRRPRGAPSLGFSPILAPVCCRGSTRARSHPDCLAARLPAGRCPCRHGVGAAVGSGGAPCLARGSCLAPGPAGLPRSRLRPLLSVWRARTRPTAGRNPGRSVLGPRSASKEKTPIFVLWLHPPNRSGSGH